MKKINKKPDSVLSNHPVCPKCGSYRIFTAGCCNKQKRKCQRCGFLAAPKYFSGTPLPSQAP